MHAHIVSEIHHNESNKIIFCMQTNCRPYLHQISNQLSRTDVARALFGKKDKEQKETLTYVGPNFYTSRSKLIY
jgi:hypothetical protein